MKRFVIEYWKHKRWILLIDSIFLLTFAITYSLYQLPIKVLGYQLVVCLTVMGICLVIDMSRAYDRYKTFLLLKTMPAEIIKEMPVIRTMEDVHYQELIVLLVQEAKMRETKMETSYQDMMMYYTTWVHQIKTPIAAMKLQLQNEDTDYAKRLSEELFRIEQYVEMVLVYLRLDSEESDYVFAYCDLDEIIKPVVRKFARQFIRKKLSLSYQMLETKVLTDEKWLSFVMEQVLSNALKYTSQGGITIEMEETNVLCIKDTGIGIAKEDLPRIFTKGYTGYNGRMDKHASGIGLFLCKRICDRLGHKIWAESQINQGTTIKIDLSKKQFEVE